MPGEGTRIAQVLNRAEGITLEKYSLQGGGKPDPSRTEQHVAHNRPKGCGIRMTDVPHTPKYLNNWSPADGTVWRDSAVWPCWRRYSTGDWLWDYLALYVFQLAFCFVFVVKI